MATNGEKRGESAGEGDQCLWRDSRINTIVEGPNEVMHSFVFAYGSKQLGEYMLGVKKNPAKAISAAT